ncbi:hypothetical protein FIE12Z_3817, partial [Fusarium flagelliforme]
AVQSAASTNTGLHFGVTGCGKSYLLEFLILCMFYGTGTTFDGLNRQGPSTSKDILESIGINAASRFPIMRLYSMEGEVSSSSIFKGAQITDCQRPHEDGHLDEANQSRVTGFNFRGTSDPGEYGTNEAVSSFNQGQCDKAFEVAIALISKTSTTPSDLVMITPYRGNLECFEYSQY